MNEAKPIFVTCVLFTFTDIYYFWHDCLFLFLPHSIACAYFLVLFSACRLHVRDMHPVFLTGFPPILRSSLPL